MSTNNKKDEEYDEITITLRLKKNIMIVGKLIAEYKYQGSFDRFVSEEVRQAILTIGPDYPEPVKDRENKLVENEEM